MIHVICKSIADTPTDGHFDGIYHRLQPSFFSYRATVHVALLVTVGAYPEEGGMTTEGIVCLALL